MPTGTAVVCAQVLSDGRPAAAYVCVETVQLRGQQQCAFPVQVVTMAYFLVASLVLLLACL
jgi:hypothetical protein